jgi:DNA-binding transcriptional ArsR family regulator
VIRIRLGAEDLRRIRIAPVRGPFAETIKAAELISGRRQSPLFASWRQSLTGRLGPEVRPLAAIHPIGSPGLDVSSIAGHADTIDEGVDALLSARREHVRAEIDWLASYRPSVEWPWTRLDSDGELRRQLGTAITKFHAEAVGPYWTQIRGYLHAERAGQIERLAAAGIDAFLAGLCPPKIQWHPPVLHVSNALEHEVDLRGSGLTFAATAFHSTCPVLVTDLANRDGPPTLLYPAVRDIGAACELWAEPKDRRALARLLGRTRSAVLDAIADGCGTGEVAQRVRISPAAASQHAAVLRRAGLITTQRTGRSVAHALTALGSAVLTGRPAAGTPERLRPLTDFGLFADEPAEG